MPAYSRILLPWDSQPQERVEVADCFRGRLKFAHIPSLGTFDAAGGRVPINASGSYLTGALPSGISNDAGSTQEHSLILQASSSLTLISIWRSRSASQYLAADATRTLLSNRTAGNAGWGWGRSGGAGGGAGGNVTKQFFVLNGVALYTEANTTIESLVDTPVACRYDKTAGLVSWFRFGRASSANTAASTSPGTGTNLVIGGSGPFGSGVDPWIDRSTVVLAFEGALSDAEIFDLTNSAQAVWSAFAPRSIWVPVSAGGGSSTNLTIQEATHGHTADSLTVTVASTFAIQEATHAHTADNLSLTVTGSTNLIIADASHAHTADNLTLSVDGATDLVIDDALHAHTADTVVITVTGDDQSLGARGKRARRGRFQDFDVPMPAEVLTSTVPSDKVVEPIAAPKVKPAPAKPSKLAKPKPKKPDAPAPEVKAKKSPKPAAPVQAPEPVKAATAPRPMMLSDILSAETMTPEEMIAAIKMLARIQLGPQLIRSTPRAKLIRA